MTGLYWHLALPNHSLDFLSSFQHLCVVQGLQIVKFGFCRLKQLPTIAKNVNLVLKVLFSLLQPKVE